MNHIIVDGTRFGGRPFDDEGHSIADFGEFGIFTRAVFADIPAARGVDTIDRDTPVSGHDIDRALSRAAVEFLPGDALLLYMGRDHLERTSTEIPAYESPFRPGIGEDGARWIAEHDVSVLCWDLSDANHPDHARFSVHILIWAVGLVIVDSCDFTDAVVQVRTSGRSTCALMRAPLRVPGATGVPVNPLLLW